MNVQSVGASTRLPGSTLVTLSSVSELIADDLGLGKPILAGLVDQELLLRHRARRVMVVRPAFDLLLEENHRRHAAR